MREKGTRLHVIRTGYPHWGGHSGIHQFLRFLDPERFRIEERIATDGDGDFPVRSPAFRRGLSSLMGDGMPWYKLSDLDAEMRALARCWRGRIDVVHFLDGEHSARFLPGLRPRRAGVVATFHQPPDLLAGLLSERALRRLDRVTVVSPDQAGWFAERLGADRVTVVLHGIDTDFFRPAAGDVGRERRDGVFRCITVGHYLRDFVAIRGVAERLAGEAVEFHVVTDRETGLEDLPNVRRHSKVDDERLLALYQGADALLLPVHQSTANNALLEGIACGLPVISTRLQSIAAYLPGGEAILVAGNDPDELTDAVRSLQEDAGAAREMGRQARRRAEELSWRNLAPRYAEIYAGVAGR
jgi:glycosyltransferase involved in cell wall biosynthesis